MANGTHGGRRLGPRDGEDIGVLLPTTARNKTSILMVPMGRHCIFGAFRLRLCIDTGMCQRRRGIVSGTVADGH